MASGDEVSVYKWKDAEGNWQFSDTPPENDVAEQVTVSTHLNRDIAPPPPETREVTTTESKSGKTKLIRDDGFAPTTISPDKISTLVEDAKNVQKLVDDRKKQLDEAITQ